jgi:acetamidase/formamidase
MSSFHINRSQLHLKWNNAQPPILTVDSGSTITYDLLDGGHNQLTEKSVPADISKFNFSLADPLFGPVFIKGAEPGDVLKVEFLDLKPASYGWTAIFPGFGLLADEFSQPALKIWDLSAAAEKNYAIFKPGIHVPVRPFLGTVGVARGIPGEFSTIPPYETGGNIDCKHITTGSVLYLPVKVTGALFSCGDGHAAQGDGEVCGTAIETPMTAFIRLTVEKGKSYVQSPHFRTSGVDVAGTGARGMRGDYAALGIHADLREASREALRGLIAWLEKEKGLSRVEAYMLASVAADLRIVEAVDMPHFAVACVLPLEVFVEE